MAGIKKDRTWTKLLEASGSRAVKHPRFEHTLTRRKLIAEMTLEAVTTGKIFFPDGTEIQIGSSEWLGMVRWLYTHIDGPAPTKVQLSSPPEESIRVEDVTPTSTADRLARLAALYEQVRARLPGQVVDDGQAHTNRFHKAGLDDLGT